MDVACALVVRRSQMHVWCGKSYSRQHLPHYFQVANSKVPKLRIISLHQNAHIMGFHSEFFLLFVAIFTSILSGQPLPPSSRRIRILTINLLHDFPWFRHISFRGELVAQAIQEHQVDIVAFQEVSDTPFWFLPNRAEEIATLVGTHTLEYRAVNGFSWIFEEGLALLSRWTIQNVELKVLERSWLFERRGALSATIVTPWNLEIQASSVHLTTNDDWTMDQVTDLYDFVSDKRQGGTPAIVMGDFNAVPDEESIRTLRGEVSIDSRRGDWIDLWSTFAPDNPGFTVPSHTPNRRIDYIFGVDGKVPRFRIVFCEQILDQAVDGIWPSDHLGILCEMEVQG